MRSIFHMSRARLNFSRKNFGGGSFLFKPQARLNFRLGEGACLSDSRKGSFGGQAPTFVAVVLSFLLFLILPNAAVSAGIHADAVVAHTNAVRVRTGQSALRVDPTLAAAAQRRAEELAAAGRFDHTRPDGSPFSTIVTDSGYPFARVGENLAIDFLNEQPLVAGWMASKSHRANLLSASHAHIGVGVATSSYGGIPTTVVVQLLGSMRPPVERGWHRLSSALPIG